MVKAIYEPPQDCAADGVNMLDDPNAKAVDKAAELLGLRKVRERGFAREATLGACGEFNCCDAGWERGVGGCLSSEGRHGFQVGWIFLDLEVLASDSSK